MLVNGTPPSAIRPNIVSQATLTTPDIVIHNLPSARYIRKCRTVLRIIGETLTAYRLAKASMWQQLFTDVTSRRQVAIQNLIISIIEDDDLMPLILSSAIILEGESSEQQQSDILDMMTRGGHRLQGWSRSTSSMYSSYVHDIPNPDKVAISKLHKGGTVNSDTYNSARKTRRLLVKSIEDEAALLSVDETMILELDCWNHLRNV